MEKSGGGREELCRVGAGDCEPERQGEGTESGPRALRRRLTLPVGSLLGPGLVGGGLPPAESLRPPGVSTEVGSSLPPPHQHVSEEAWPVSEDPSHTLPLTIPPSAAPAKRGLEGQVREVPRGGKEEPSPRRGARSTTIRWTRVPN